MAVKTAVLVVSPVCGNVLFVVLGFAEVADDGQPEVDPYTPVPLVPLVPVVVAPATPDDVALNLKFTLSVELKPN